MEANVILCDYAQVHGGKLYIVGAPVNLIATITAEAPHPIQLYAGILVTIPWNAHNLPHRLRIALVSEDGEIVPIVAPISPEQATVPAEPGVFLAQFNAGRSAMMQPGEDTIMPLVVPLAIAVPKLGGYILQVDIDGARATQARFRVLHSAQIAGMTAGG